MAVRKAEVLYIGDAASIVRAAKEAEAAQAQLAAAAKSAGAEIAGANKVAGDSSVASATKQVAAHKRASVALASTASAMSRLTAPILLAAGAGVKFAVDFQSQMEQVHTQAGASQAEVTKMSKALLALAPATEQGPKALAQSMYLVESASLRGKNALLTVKAAAQGAAVGGSDLTDTTDALVGAMVAMHEKGDMAATTMGSIDAAVGVGKMHMQDFVNSLKSGIIPTAYAVGLSFNSVASGLATMTDAGVPAEMAATKMRTILLMLADEHTKAAIENLHTIGLTSDNLATAMRKPGNGLLDVLQLLQDHLDGLSKVKQVDIISSLAGGSRSAGTLITLLQQMGRIQSKYGQISTLSTQFNQRMAAESETAGHKIKTAWSAVQATLIQVGGAVAPVVQTLAGDVSKVAQWFTALPTGMQHAIVTGGLIVAGIGPALKIASIFEKGITALGGIARTAARLALGRGFSGNAGGSAISTVARTVVPTMEVGEMFVRGMVGGAGGLPGGLSKDATVAEGEVATAAAASRASLARLVPVLGGVAVGAKGLYDAFNGSGGGLQGGIERFLKGITFGMVPSSAFRKPGGPTPLDIAQIRGNNNPLTGGMFGDTPSKDVLALGKLIDKIKSVQGNLSKLTPTALVNLKNAAERMAQDPSLARYRGTLLTVLRGLSNVADSAEGQGKKIAQGLEKGWNSSRFQSEPIMLQQLQSKIKGLPPQMQSGAIESVIAYAKGLQSKGRLPAGAWQLMLAQVSRLFPGWAKGLGAAGALSAATFTKAMDLSKAEANTKHTLDNISGDFPEVSKAIDATKGDVITKSAAAVRALRSIDTTGSAPMTAAVIADTHRLRASVSADLGKMVAVSASSGKDMAHSIQSGSAFAAQSAESNFGRVASAVGRAMNSGLLSAGTGAQDIGHSLNAMLTAFGQKAIPIVGSVTQQLNWQKWWQGGSTGSMSAGPGHHARGGVVQFGRAGDRGSDSIPVNFGGTHIKVGSGELGTVLTATQQAELNARTADVGGLRGFFSKFRRPHNMGQGGIVTASEFGGPNDPGTGSVGYRGDNLYVHPDSYAELNMGTALGGLPYMAPLNVSFRGHTARLFKRDIGAGGPGLNGHTRAIDLWYQAAQALGFSGLADVLVNGGSGVNVSIAGGGGMGQIPVPKVRGTGTVARIVRALLGRETKAANQYAMSHMPSVNMGIAGLPSSGGFNPADLGVFDGLSVAKWIIPELAWARAHGWAGRVTSGWRSPSQVVHGVFATAPQGQSEHQYDIYPGGAVDVSDYAQFASIIAGYPGPEKLIQLPIDPLHFSGTGHARGGMFSPTPRAAGGPMAAGGVYRVGENGPETLYMNQGGVVRNPGASLAGSALTPAQLSSFGLTKTLIFPIAAALSALQKLISNGLSNHTNAIAKLRSTITTLNGQIVQARAAGNSSLVLALRTERTAIEKRIKSLEQTSAREVNKRIADLTQLQAFRDAITQLRNTTSGLVSQATQAFGAARTGRINAAHTAAIRAIGNSPAAKLLRKLQAQDVAEQNSQQLGSLNQAVTDAQFLVARSGGQTHIDALAQLKAAQQALSDYQRQQEEAKLQASLASATKGADKTQQTALAGLKKEEANYKAMLQHKFAALLLSLKAGKISYATWAKDVDGILGKYHLRIPTDSATEITLTAGPGVLGPHRRVVHVQTGHGHVPSRTVYSDAPIHGRMASPVHIDKAYFTGTQSARAFADRMAHRAGIGSQ